MKVRATATAHATKSGPPIDIVSAMNHKSLFGPWFKGDSWDG